MKRLDSLDYLRGMMTISVMMFHYVSWSVGEPETNSLLGKLGIYAVSIFYILSGLSLSFVYFSIGKAFSIKEFAIKRLFRMVPIFWCCLIFVLLLRYLQGYLVVGELYQPVWTEIIFNFSLLFGFFMPDKYFSVGAWSIGNEIVFYTIFPFIIYSCMRFGRVVAVCWLLLSIVIGWYFPVFLFDETKGLEENWSLYVNPLNQFFLFVSGICIAMFFKPNKLNSLKLKWTYAFSLVCLFFIFSYLPVGSQSIELVTGLGRFYFSLLSVLIVLNVYLFQFSIKGFMGNILMFFGRCCYSIYLIHPIVALPLSFLLHDKLGLNLIITYLISSVITLAASALVYSKIEKPMMDIGKALSKKTFREVKVIHPISIREDL